MSVSMPTRLLHPRSAVPPALCCRDCGRPFATVQGTVLIVHSLHAGDKHVNAISLTQLIELLRIAEGRPGLYDPQ